MAGVEERYSRFLWLCYEIDIVFIQSHSVFELPDDTQLISVVRLGDKICISHKQGPASADSLADHSEPDIPPEQTTLPSRLNFLYHIQLHNGTIMSDGSYKQGQSTFAFLAQPR
jgi:hypothetical protein